MSPVVSATARLSGRVVPRSAVSQTLRTEMFALLGAHFGGVDRGTFESDFAEKNFAILLEDDGGRPRLVEGAEGLAGEGVGLGVCAGV